MIDEALKVALAAGREAAEIVMRVYAEPFDVDYKGPNDPVTRADKEANALICARLASAFPEVPIVAEESDPRSFEGYTRSRYAFFVDPLDGTREFVAKNGEFAVMIGLAEEGAAVMGVIVCPAYDRTFYGARGVPAVEKGPIQVSKVSDPAEARVLVSRSHRPPNLDEVVARIGARQVIPTGSSGLKAVKVACGEADLYLQPGHAGKLWDTCAPEAIVRAAGGIMTDARGRPFDYRRAELPNKDGLVATNPVLHAKVI
jgi:3'(2'), 5'-bisphosphate nucleotidase